MNASLKLISKWQKKTRFLNEIKTKVQQLLDYLQNPKQFIYGNVL